MPRKSKIFKLMVVMALILVVIILFMRSSSSDHFKKLQMHQQQEELFKELKNNRSVVSYYADLRLDYNSREPSNAELITEIQKKMPSLPIEYFYRHSNKVLQKFKNCAQYPAIQVLNFYNTYWQSLYVDNSVYQLYGAYYDERLSTGAVIRILAMSNYPHNKFPTIYCQLWFEDDNRPVLSLVKEYQIIWDTNWGVVTGVYYPYLMTCEMPKNTNTTGSPIPKAVNLVEHQCDTAKNSLRILYNKPTPMEKKHETIAVCVKGLDFPYEDLSARLVEWLEMLRILGVEKVYINNLQVHGNVTKVLDYYQSEGFVEVHNITLVGGVVEQPALQHWLIKTYPLNKRLNELIPYNDCFYRNMYKYDYIALLDIDEIIMPKGNLTTWQYLLAKAKSFEKENKCPFGFASLCVRNVYFPTDWEVQQLPKHSNPSYMYMLNHAYRFHDYTSEHLHVKCLHSTQHILTLHNHYPLSYLKRSCKPLDMPTSYAQLQHYRAIKTNKGIVRQNYNTLKDDNMERFRKPLIERCAKVLRQLKFIK